MLRTAHARTTNMKSSQSGFKGEEASSAKPRYRPPLCKRHARRVVALISFSIAWVVSAVDYRDWTAVDGYANDAENWSGGTLPSATEAPRFKGTGTFVVRFPSDGYTIPGNFVTVREMSDGGSVTFDATEGDWLQTAESYLSTSWQSFMVCASAGGTWPHILNVINTTNGKPLFRLSGGRVKFTRNASNGSTLEMLDGTWNFYDPTGTANGSQGLALLNAVAADSGSRVVFRGGSLRAANFYVDCGTPNSRVVFTGGNHQIYGTITVGRNDPGTIQGGYLPTLQVSGGILSLESGQLAVGNRTGKEGRLLMDSNGNLTVVSNMWLASAASAIGTVDMADSSCLTVGGNMIFAYGSSATGEVSLASASCLTVGGEFVMCNQAGTRAAISLAGTSRLVQTQGGDKVRLSNANNSKANFDMSGDSSASFAGRFTVGAGNAGSEATMTLADNASLTIADKDGLTIGRFRNGTGLVHIGGNAELLLPEANYSNSGGICLSGSNNQWGDNRSASSRLVMEGGRIYAPSAQLILCGTNSVATLSGGETDFFRWWIKGDTNDVLSADWVTPTNTILVTGGTHSLGGQQQGSELFVGESGTDARLDVRGGSVSLYKELTVGIGATGRGSATFALSGTGRVEIKRRENDAVLAIASKSANARARAELTGGELVASCIRGGTGNSELLADGVKFTLNGVDATAAIRDVTTATLGAQGLTLDTAGKDAAIAQTFADAPGAAGLFVKTGDGALMVDTASSHARTVVSNGTLATALRFGRSLEIAPGATLDVSGAQGISLETLTLSDAGSAMVATLVWDMASPIEITSANGLSLGKAEVVLSDATTTGAFPIFCVAGTLDASALGNLKVVNMNVARSYVFAASAEGGVTTVTLTISAVEVADNIWTGAEGSDWTADNFTSAPAATHRYVFPSDAASKNVTIPAQGATARGVAVAGDYSFGGGTLELLGGIAVSSGTATFGNALELSGDQAFDVAAGTTLALNGPLAASTIRVTRTGNGTFVLGTANPDYRGAWSLAGGFHRFADAAAFGTAIDKDIEFVSGTLQYTGANPGTVARQIAVNGAADQSRVVVDAGVGLTLAKGINSTHGGLVKTGGGALTLEYPTGTWQLGTGNVNSGDNSLVSTLSADGTSPANANSSVTAGLQILDGTLLVKGAGVENTTVNQLQKIWIGTGYAGQSSPVSLEIEDVTYNQGGATRALVVGGNVASGKDNKPSLLVKNAALSGNTLQIGNGSAVSYPSVAVTNATVAMIYEVTIGQTSDNVHPTLRIGAGGTVRQNRPSGSATGIVLNRNVDVEVAVGGVLETIKGDNGSNCGVRFNSGAYGQMRFADGGTLRTYMFTADNTPTPEKHVEMAFDGGVLVMTRSGDTSLGTSPYQVFKVEDGGMEVVLGAGIAHGFATPFMGEGTVVKTGSGTLTLRPCDVAGHDVIETDGGLEVREGAVNLGGEAIAVSGIWGAGAVTNGTLSGTIVAKNGATDVLTLGEGLTARGGLTVSVTADDPETLARNQVIPVARVDGADVDVSRWRCRVANDDLRGACSLSGGVVYVTLKGRSGMTIIFK